MEAERFAGLLVVRGYVQLGSGGGGADAIGVNDPESKNSALVLRAEITTCEFDDLSKQLGAILGRGSGCCFF